MNCISPKRQEQKSRLFHITLCWLLGSFCLTVTNTLAAEQFPLYPCINANVKFWEEVYSRYSTRQGILHDIDDLSRIYAVIDLEDWEVPGSAKINSERIKHEKNRIDTILANLESGEKPTTLEERKIAALFSQQRHTTYQEARDNIRLQIGQKDRFYEGLIRSGKYIAQFKSFFVSQGLPAELAYLPHVESSFNPKAYSKAGAAGLWQFTRSTGRDYLTINENVDERYDPYLATQAAAKLLKENYAQLETWPLALTAYNYGRAGMVRAVNEHGNYENIFKSYSQGYFKFASRNFYSEFLAATRVAKRLAADSRVPYERPEATTTLRLKEDTPIARLRSSFRVSPQEFTRLNAALLEPVLNGQKSVPKGYLVRLPANKQAQALQSKMKTGKENSTPEVTTQKRIEPSKSISSYTVQRGDTLSSIARQFQLSPKTLLAANCRNGLAEIRIGEKLIIPKATIKKL